MSEGCQDKRLEYSISYLSGILLCGRIRMSISNRNTLFDGGQFIPDGGSGKENTLVHSTWSIANLHTVYYEYSKVIGSAKSTK